MNSEAIGTLSLELAELPWVSQGKSADSVTPPDLGRESSGN